MATHVLMGVAGSGKTTRLLERYRAELRQGRETKRPGRCVWLAPTLRAAREIRRRLDDGTAPVLFSPNVFTFDGFAERVLQTSSHAITPMTPAVQRMLLRGVVERLRSAGRLKYFESIVATTGFLDLVATFIAELKRNEIWPEMFADACERSPFIDHSARERELTQIYHDYQQLLVARGLYDAEGRFWSAHETLRSGEWGPFAELDFVVLDGFTDLTHTQYKLLTLFSERSAQIWMSLLGEERGEREELFAKTNGVLARLPQLGAVMIDYLPAPRADAGHPARLPAAIQHIACDLFGNPRGTPSLRTEGVSLVSAAGLNGEVQHLVARVKHLLLTGVSPSDIVVGSRDLDRLGPLIEKQFEAAGIPVANDVGTPLAATSVVKFLFSLLQLELDDWSYARLANVLNSSYFRPTRPGLDQPQTAREVLRILRKTHLVSGRERILLRLNRYVAQPPRELINRSADHPEEEAIASLERVLGYLTLLSDTLAPLRADHTFAEWTDVLKAIAAQLGLVPHADVPAFGDQGDSTPDMNARVQNAGHRNLATDIITHTDISASANADADADRWPDLPAELVTRDRRVWELLERVLYDIAWTERHLQLARPPFSLSKLCGEWLDLLGRERLPSEKSEQGRVRLLDMLHVRNLEIPYLFLCGLTEESFPRHRTDDCVLNEGERRLLHDAGLSLGLRAERSQEEMLLFYSIVTRARKELVLTYPAVSSNGTPQSQTSYLVALQALFDPATLRITLEEQLEPVPADDRVFSLTDLRVRGMHDALHRQPGLLRSALGDRSLVPAIRNSLRAAEMNQGRFHAQGFTEFEGLLQSAANRRWMQERFAARHEFNASELEAYANCPYQFFAAQVLRVQPLESIEEELDAGNRGVIVHDVLAHLHRQLRDELLAAGMVRGSDLLPSSDQVRERFLKLLADRFARMPIDSDVERTILRIEHDALKEYAQEYAMQWGAYVASIMKHLNGACEPRLFEVPFGAKPSRHDAMPPAPALVIGHGEQMVAVNGRIDRIDAGLLPTGETVFSVIDYKTGAGSKPNLNSLDDGKSLQLVLYALAVQRLQLLGGPASVFKLGEWHVSQTGFRPMKLQESRRTTSGPVPDEEWGRIADSLDEIVIALAQSMRAGQFPVFSERKQCTQFCDFSTCCRVSQIRGLPASLNKTWDPKSTSNSDIEP